jgi:hypothetical protein
MVLQFVNEIGMFEKGRSSLLPAVGRAQNIFSTIGLLII